MASRIPIRKKGNDKDSADSQNNKKLTSTTLLQSGLKTDKTDDSSSNIKKWGKFKSKIPVRVKTDGLKTDETDDSSRNIKKWGKFKSKIPVRVKPSGQEISTSDKKKTDTKIIKSKIPVRLEPKKTDLLSQKIVGGTKKKLKIPILTKSKTDDSQSSCVEQYEVDKEAEALLRMQAMDRRIKRLFPDMSTEEFDRLVEAFDRDIDIREARNLSRSSRSLDSSSRGMTSALEESVQSKSQRKRLQTCTALEYSVCESSAADSGSQNEGNFVDDGNVASTSRSAYEEEIVSLEPSYAEFESVPDSASQTFVLKKVSPLEKIRTFFKKRNIRRLRLRKVLPTILSESEPSETSSTEDPSEKRENPSENQ